MIHPAGQQRLPNLTTPRLLPHPGRPNSAKSTCGGLSGLVRGVPRRPCDPQALATYRGGLPAGLHCDSHAAGGDSVAMADLPLQSATKDEIRRAFATYADTHEPAAVRRCRPTWNTLCSLLYTSELIPANPMAPGRPTQSCQVPANIVAHRDRHRLTRGDQHRRRITAAHRLGRTRSRAGLNLAPGRTACRRAAPRQCW